MRTFKPPVSLKHTGACALAVTLAAAIAAGACGHAQAADNADDPVADLTVVQPQPRLPGGAASTMALAIGDRLKITLFEQYAPETGGTASQHGVLPTLVERSDVTGEYVVQEDGTIFLPLVGALSATGQTLDRLQTAMEEKFSTSFDGHVKASIQLVEREPVYVTGSVAHPGTFKHIPGMTVMQAVILAGSDTVAGDDGWRKIDVTREEERTRKSEGHLADLYVREAVLVAERNKLQAEAPRALIALSGQADADRMIADAVRLRGLERQKAADEKSALADSISAMEQELTVLREGMVQVEQWMKDIAKRVETMRAIRSNGDMTNITMFAARNDLTTAQDRWNERRLAIARVERSLTEARHSQTQMEMNETMARETAIKETADAIREEEVTRITMGRLLQQATAVSPFVPRGQATRSYRISRRTPEGLKTVDADEYAPLQPGDILQVISTDPSMRQALGE